MSGAPNTTALAALLRSHPEECAAVVAYLAAGGAEAWTAEQLAWHTKVHQGVDRFIVALAINGIVTATIDGCTAPCIEDRAAIARMGAAAWLAARVGPPASTNPLNLGAIRLCALASEALAIGAAHVAMVAVETPFPRDAFEYRLRLTVVEQVSEGLPVAALDVDAEVAAVWGAGAPTKGEQR